MKRVILVLISLLLVVAFLPYLGAARGRFCTTNSNQIVVAAITELSLLEELSCTVDCVSTVDSANFLDGYIAMRGGSEERLEKANGEFWIRDDQGFEVVRDSESTVYSWSSTGEALDFWSMQNGVEDVRLPLIAATQASGLVSKPNELVDGIDCIVLEGDGLKLWFEDVAQNRLLKCEVSYDPAVASGVVYSVRFRDWISVGNAEYPQSIDTIAYDPEGNQTDTWSYSFSDFVTGVHLSNSEFVRNSSAGSGSGGGTVGPGGF